MVVDMWGETAHDTAWHKSFLVMSTEHVRNLFWSQGVQALHEAQQYACFFFIMLVKHAVVDIIDSSHRWP